MTLRLKTLNARLQATLMAGVAVLSHVSIAQTTDNHNATKRSEALLQREPNDIVDEYLNSISCDNKGRRLWRASMSLAAANPLDYEAITGAFEGKIFYSLMPGEEKLGQAHLRETFEKSEKLLSHLKTLAGFFGHDIHNFLRNENQRRQSLHLPELSREEFLKQFNSGEIILSSEKINNLKPFLQEQISTIESLTASMKYGCDGNQNFLHRQDSEMGKTLTASAAFIIPATDAARALANLALSKDKPKKARQPAAPTHEKIQAPDQLAAAGDAEQDASSSRKFKYYANFLKAGVPQKALDEAMANFFKFSEQGSFDAVVNGEKTHIPFNKSQAVIVDYTRDSNETRFWILDLNTGTVVKKSTTGHGNGRGLAERQMPRNKMAFVSNSDKSLASPAGSMLTLGKKEKSERLYPTALMGLEPQNSNTQKREILVHAGVNGKGETYVTYDDAGRSQGCFAIPEDLALWVMKNLPRGTFLHAYKGNIPQIDVEPSENPRTAKAVAQRKALRAIAQVD